MKNKNVLTIKLLLTLSYILKNYIYKFEISFKKYSNKYNMYCIYNEYIYKKNITFNTKNI